MKIIAYTDGSYRASKNQGGVGIVWLKDNEFDKEFSMPFKGETNQTMELKAIWIALYNIKKEIDSLEIISDSKYCIGVLTNPTWKPKKNIELIGKIKKQIEETQKLVKEPIKFTHVKGHNGDKWNERANTLAQSASELIL